EGARRELCEIQGDGQGVRSRTAGKVPCRVRDQEGRMKAQSFLAGVVSLIFLGIFLGIWHLATLPKQATVSAAENEYAKLMGKGTKKSDGFPTLAQMREAALTQLSDPLYDRGPNDKGIAIQLGHSLARVAAGYFLALLLAVPLGFA